MYCNTGQRINVHTAEGLGRLQFTGEDPAAGGFPIDNPAHEHMDENGDLWSMNGMYRVTGNGVGMSEYVLQ